jgi:glycosyltransferase involved in cell wall biosynthesis
MSEHSITIIVPARDEELNLEQSVQTVVSVVQDHFSDYEVLVFDDGSTDRTGAIADALAQRYERVTAFHNPRPLCLGGVVRLGIERAAKTFVMYVDGKGATTAEALEQILSRRDEADLVIPYPANLGERAVARRLISYLFVWIMNVTFRLRLRYYTHLVLCRTSLARSVRARTDSYAFQAERVIKLIKSGCSYVEVPVRDRYEIEGRRSKAFQLGNIAGVARLYLGMVCDVVLRRTGGWTHP